VRKFAALPAMLLIGLALMTTFPAAAQSGAKGEQWKYSVLANARIPSGAGKVTSVWSVDETELANQQLKEVDALNRMGKDGWELTTIDRDDASKVMQTTKYYFKKRI
jgi:hypothetical protein